MKEYRYFLTDETRIGTLLKSSSINGQAMILLIGHIIATQAEITVSNIAAVLIANYGFEVIKKKIDIFTLNTSDETPYTYYDLLDEGGYCESDGYMYTDIDEISKHFSSAKAVDMLKSIHYFDKRHFS